MGSKTILKYHLVLTTKYRKPSLLGIEQEVYKAIRNVEKHSSFKIIDMNVEHGNHIHIAIQTVPKYSISSVVNRIKGYTQNELWDNNEKHLKKFYWGKSHKLWHGSYYCSTIGNVSSEKILEYIKKQDGPREIIM